MRLVCRGERAAAPRRAGPRPACSSSRTRASSFARRCPGDAVDEGAAHRVELLAQLADAGLGRGHLLLRRPHRLDVRLLLGEAIGLRGRRLSAAGRFGGGRGGVRRAGAAAPGGRPAERSSFVKTFASAFFSCACFARFSRSRAAVSPSPCAAVTRGNTRASNPRMVNVRPAVMDFLPAPRAEWHGPRSASHPARWAPAGRTRGTRPPPRQAGPTARERPPAGAAAAAPPASP